jgi:NAD(P)-dependent dehydrogenase (short-subunit alcohol dehydrogenase family)
VTTLEHPAPARVGEKLVGRVAFVTGGTRGIGAAICHSLASQGATVAAGYNSGRERAEALFEELAQYGGRTSTHQGNVGSAEDCRRTIAEVMSRAPGHPRQQRRDHVGQDGPQAHGGELV